MPTVQETLETLSDAELSKLLDRVSDDLELQRAELGLPVDETPEQIAAKRSQESSMAGMNMGGMGDETQPEKTGVEAEVAPLPPEKPPAGEVGPEMDATGGEKPADNTQAATPEVDAISAMVTDKIGRTPGAAMKLAKMLVEAVGDPKEAQRLVEAALSGSGGAHEAAPAFDGLFKDKTGKGALGALL